MYLGAKLKRKIFDDGVIISFGFFIVNWNKFKHNIQLFILTEEDVLFMLMKRVLP